MRLLHSEEFIGICRDQNVELKAPITAALETSDIRIEEAYVPTGILAGIAAAGRYLRHFPGRNIAMSSLDDRELDDADTATKTLSAMINGSITPVEPLEGQPAFTHGRKTQTIALCPYVEVGFLSTAQSLERFIDGTPFYNGSQIISDEQGPVLLRKTDGVQTCIALREVNINGVVYPAGSIIKAFVGKEQDITLSAGARPDRVEVVPVQRVNGAMFGRLSAYAFTPEERQEGFVYHRTTTGSERRAISGLTIDYISELATEAALLVKEKTLH